MLRCYTINVLEIGPAVVDAMLDTLVALTEKLIGKKQRSEFGYHKEVVSWCSLCVRRYLYWDDLFLIPSVTPETKGICIRRIVEIGSTLQL